MLTLIVMRGSAWTGAHYYWLNLAVGPAIALFLAGLATRRPVRLVRLLSRRPLQAVGGFSYSLYLIHMPIVALISTLIVVPSAGSRLAVFGVTVVLVIPLCLAAARLFAAAFERRTAPRVCRSEAGLAAGGDAGHEQQHDRQAGGSVPAPATMRRRSRASGTSWRSGSRTRGA